MLSRQLLRDLLYGSAIKRPYSPSRRKSRTRKHAIFFPFAGKRFHRRRVYYCANRGVHPGGYRIAGKPSFWGGRPLCKHCHRFFTASRIKKLG